MVKGSYTSRSKAHSLPTPKIRSQMDTVKYIISNDHKVNSYADDLTLFLAQARSINVALTR